MHFRRLLCLVLCLSAAALRADDQVYNLEGSLAASGTITQMTAAQVVVSTSAGDRTVPANQIRNIFFDEDTGEIRTAKNRVVNGQLEQALEELNAMNFAEVRRPEARADLEYYKAYCMTRVSLQGAGDKLAAARAMNAFLTNHKTGPGSYHMFEAAELTGDLSQAMGRFDLAADYYGMLNAAPWPDVKMKGSVLQAGALIAQEKYAEAAAKYDQVLAMQNTDPASQRQKLFAQVGKAYCVGMAGQPDQGIAMVDQVIKDNNPQDVELFGRAYNAKGVCLLAAGRKKEALRAFLHTDLMFTADPDAHAEALYHLAKLFEDQQQSERALQKRSLLKSRYASTVWAQK